MSPLFTFFLDFDGGTYITQVAGTLEEACEKWFSTGVQNVDELDDADKVELTRSFTNDELIRVDGVKNVWCLSGLVKERLALLHIVQTESGEIPNPKSEI